MTVKQILKPIWDIIILILMVCGVLFIGQCIYQQNLSAENLKAKYYLTDEKRETKQFFVAEDWPIVKEWNIQIIWLDSSNTLMGVESNGHCGVIRFKTIEFIDKENFRDCEYVGKKEYTCEHFHWTLNHELEVR
jgi:hypothetical protein